MVMEKICNSGGGRERERKKTGLLPLHSRFLEVRLLGGGGGEGRAEQGQHQHPLEVALSAIG